MASLFFNQSNLGQLLLNEERPQVRELPSARNGQNSQLNESPADNTTVGSLGLVTEFGFTFLLGNHISDCLESHCEIAAGFMFRFLFDAM